MQGKGKRQRRLALDATPEQRKRMRSAPAIRTPRRVCGYDGGDGDGDQKCEAPEGRGQELPSLEEIPPVSGELRSALECAQWLLTGDALSDEERRLLGLQLEDAAREDGDVVPAAHYITKGCVAPSEGGQLVRGNLLRGLMICERMRHQREHERKGARPAAVFGVLPRGPGCGGKDGAYVGDPDRPPSEEGDMP